MERLTARFDEAIYDLWEPHPRPTNASLGAIASRLRVDLPAELVEIAKKSSRFSNVFLSLGENYESHDHIIPYNQYWKSRRRTRRLPADLVIISNGFMDEDFWCLVRPPATSTSSDPAVEYWSPAPIGYPKESQRGPRYETFTTFLEAQIEHHGKHKKRS